MHLASLVKAGFELVAEGHQLIDFGNDAVLFCCWRERKRKCFNFLRIECWLRTAMPACTMKRVHSLRPQPDISRSDKPSIKY